MAPIIKLPPKPPAAVELNIVAPATQGFFGPLAASCNPFSKPFFAPAIPPLTSATKVAVGIKLGTILSAKIP